MEPRLLLGIVGGSESRRSSRLALCEAGSQPAASGWLSFGLGALASSRGNGASRVRQPDPESGERCGTCLPSFRKQACSGCANQRSVSCSAALRTSATCQEVPAKTVWGSSQRRIHSVSAAAAFHGRFRYKSGGPRAQRPPDLDDCIIANEAWMASRRQHCALAADSVLIDP